MDSSSYYLPIIKVRIAGKTSYILVDTGACCSILTKEVYNKIKDDALIKKVHSEPSVSSLTGQKLNITGCYDIPIMIGDKNIKHNLLIIDQKLSTKYDGIFGIDILQKFKFHIDLENNMLVSQNTRIPIKDANEIRFNNVTFDFAKLTNKCILEPNENKMYKLSIDTAAKIGDVIKVSKLPHLIDMEIKEDTAIVSKNKTIEVTISNITQERFVLNKLAKIATVEKIGSERDMEHIIHLRRQQFNINDFKLNHLKPHEKRKLTELLEEFSDIFSSNLETIGQTDQITPEIKVDKSKLQTSRHYPVPFALRDELRSQLDELLRADIIQPTNTHISHPVILVKKKPTADNQVKYRIVNDYRITNGLIKFNRHPLPLINDLLDNLKDSEYYSTIDLQSSFFQVKLKPEDREITAFTTIYGSFEYKSMSQGLSFAPQVLQALTDKLLSPIKDLKISNYIDDFAVGSPTFESMIFKLRKLFERLRNFGLTVNPKKCTFLVPTVTFLGHKVDKNGTQPIVENIRKIQDFPRPRTQRQCRRYLGICSYYRRYIQNYSEISLPLTNLTKKRQRFKWTPEAQTAFETLKQKLSEPPVLIHPDHNSPFILTTDASLHTVSGYLGQKDRYGIIRPISYFSRKLSQAEKNYPIHQKEFLAIIDSVKAYKNYLYGKKFTIRCDNAAIQSITKLENPADRVARWILYLQEYEYEFEKISGSENFIADTFSRDFHQINSIVNQLPTVSEIAAEQKRDPKLTNLIKKLKSKTIDLSPSEQDFFIKDDILMHASNVKRSVGPNYVEQIVVPEKLKPIILKLGHAAHFGLVKTYDNIKTNYYWKNLYSDVQNYILSCHECVGYKSPNKLAPVPLQRNYIPCRPGELVSLDYVGKLPTTAKGNSYILVFIDHFTKFMRLYATSNMTAETTADKLYEYVCLMGIPSVLLSDLGRNFTSELFRLVAKRLGTEKIYSTAYHPQENGGNETTHRALKQSLSILARETKQWDDAIPFYELCYNNTIHSTTGEKPSYLVHGYDITLPITPPPQNTQHQYNNSNAYPTYIEKRTRQHQKAIKIVEENILKATEKMENYQHKTAKDRVFYLGQLVFLLYPEMDRNAHLPKRRNYHGPYRIVDIHSSVNYSIQDTRNTKAKTMKVHSSRLIPYTERRKNLEVIEEEEETRPQTIPKSLPPAQFDDEEEALPQTFWITSRTNPPVNVHEVGPRQVTGENGNDSQSFSDDETQIYDVEQELRTSTPAPVQQARTNSHRYNLRSQNRAENIQNPTTNQLGGDVRQCSLNNESLNTEVERQGNWSDRIMELALNATAPSRSDEPSRVIQFLDRLSNSLQ